LGVGAIFFFFSAPAAAGLLLCGPDCSFQMVSPPTEDSIPLFSVGSMAFGSFGLFSVFDLSCLFLIPLTRLPPFFFLIFVEREHLLLPQIPEPPTSRSFCNTPPCPPRKEQQQSPPDSFFIVYSYQTSLKSLRPSRTSLPPLFLSIEALRNPEPPNPPPDFQPPKLSRTLASKKSECHPGS